MLRNIAALVEAMNSSGIRYCHWKSNSALNEALSGLTDIDLLIHRLDADMFRAELARCGFRPADDGAGVPNPSSEHHFGLDGETGRLAHVHAYYRVITGESLAKNFHLPVEEMLLQNTRAEGLVAVPIKAADLVVFAVRVMLKHTTLVELILLARDWKNVRQESSSLIDDESIAEAVQFVREWLPPVDPALFVQCVVSLQKPASLMKRLLLARRLRSSLRNYARRSQIRASCAGLSKFLELAARRLTRRSKGMVLRSGGSLVAFVGPEATGKSTLIAEVSRWLGEHFNVRSVHAGKPRLTILTLLPHIAVPLLRIVAPQLRPSKLEEDHSAFDGDESGTWVYPLSFGLRAVMLAYERRVLLSRAFGRTASGGIVLCDRYPYLARGASDGPKLMYCTLPSGGFSMRCVLSAFERRLYLQMPRPDLIIRLTAPVEVAVARNRIRGKLEPEEYVRRRHAAATSFHVDKVPVCSIDTNRDFDKTLIDVKKAIWSAF